MRNMPARRGALKSPFPQTQKNNLKNDLKPLSLERLVLAQPHTGLAETTILAFSTFAPPACSPR